jgi:hypothetical protein
MSSGETLPCPGELISIFVSLIIGGLFGFGLSLGLSTLNFSWRDFPGVRVPANLAIAVAVVAMVADAFAIFAICAYSGHKGLIFASLILCGIVAVFEFVVAITAFVYPLTILASIDEHWDDLAFNESRFAVEVEFECCGFGWYDDERTCGFTKSSNVETKSCKSALAGSIEKYGNTMGFGTIGMVGAEIVFLLFVYCYRFVVTCDKKDKPTDKKSGFETVS